MEIIKKKKVTTPQRTGHPALGFLKRGCKQDTPLADCKACWAVCSLPPPSDGSTALHTSVKQFPIHSHFGKVGNVCPHLRSSVDQQSRCCTKSPDISVHEYEQFMKIMTALKCHDPFWMGHHWFPTPCRCIWQFKHIKSRESGHGLRKPSTSVFVSNWSTTDFLGQGIRVYRTRRWPPRVFGVHISVGKAKMASCVEGRKEGREGRNGGRKWTDMGSEEDGNKVDNTNSFIYLGSFIAWDNGCSMETVKKVRLNQGDLGNQKTMPGDKGISLNTEIRLFKTCIVLIPAVCSRNISLQEDWCWVLKWLSTVNWQDHIRNKIRKKIDKKEMVTMDKPLYVLRYLPNEGQMSLTG